MLVRKAAVEIWHHDPMQVWDLAVHLSFVNDLVEQFLGLFAVLFWVEPFPMDSADGEDKFYDNGVGVVQSAREDSANAPPAEFFLVQNDVQSHLV